MQINVKKLHPNAKLPTKAHEADAGWDVYCSESVHILPDSRRKIPLGIAVAVPKGWCAVMFSKSGLSVKFGTVVEAPVIDAGYNGEINCIMINAGEETIQFDAGDKVAQILILQVPEIEMIEVTELSETERGDGGFGSTGR